MPDFPTLIEQHTGQAVRSSSASGGGCINDARLFALADGSKVFTKTHPQAAQLPGVFTSEARGLEKLANADTPLFVPRPIAAGDDYIIMQAIEPAPRPADFAEQLGRGIALLHKNTTADRFGFDCDNYLGVTPQTNAWHDDWITFWVEHRMKPMLDRVRGDDELDWLGAKLLDRLDDVLAAPVEPPALLHGDLWSGNAESSTQGIAIFDPACYFGHREAELGMTRLFGFGPGFEAAYHETYPLADGHDRRIAVYTLYHLLNHLHLFGRSYYSQSIALLRSIG